LNKTVFSRNILKANKVFESNKIFKSEKTIKKTLKLGNNENVCILKWSRRQ